MREKGGGYTSLSTWKPNPGTCKASWYTDAAMMRTRLATFVVLILIASAAFGSAYQASPKLLVILIIDQFRGDYLERYHDEFGPNGFRTFTDRGAYFPACYYDYANTRTAPGHATIGTGTYTSGHGIFSNEWWVPASKKVMSSVDDESTKIVGAEVEGMGASPHNLLADTLGDELRLATQGNSRVFGIALKDRAAILPTGFSANGAYWIDKTSGAWVTSTYYVTEAPHWLTNFNSQKHAQRYLNLDWKDANGEVLGSTAPHDGPDGKAINYFELVGRTPYANDYQFEFARELIQQEKLGQGTVTDLLVISLSANDLTGHAYGPDSPQMHAMALALDRQVSEFLGFLQQQYGNRFWIALTADHGVAPTNATSLSLRIPGVVIANKDLRAELNKAVGARLHKSGDYIRSVSFPIVFVNNEAFADKVTEADAEGYVAEAMRSMGFVTAYSKEQLASGEVAPSPQGRMYANSYSPYGGWWVMGLPPPFTLSAKDVADHGVAYSYDQHVPLAFYGAPFKPGVYRDQVEPIDLAPTLAVVLGINKPTSSTGHVLSQALSSRSEVASPPVVAKPRGAPETRP
jgi:predicted AlkP superfamily pyrophosphatase or phosphodiesterase